MGGHDPRPSGLYGTADPPNETDVAQTGSGVWAHLGSNQGPLACEASALPLSYAPGRTLRLAAGSPREQVARGVVRLLVMGTPEALDEGAHHVADPDHPEDVLFLDNR
jgi:hypothetical protein